jgi:hypothetical protein
LAAIAVIGEHDQIAISAFTMIDALDVLYSRHRDGCALTHEARREAGLVRKRG